MYGYQSPELTLLVHKTMVEEEMRRRHPEHHRSIRDTERGSGPLTGLRAFTGSIFIAIGERITPPQRRPRSRATASLAGHARN